MKQIRKLKSRKYRYDYRQYLIEGVKMITEALTDAHIAGIFYAESKAQDEDIKALIKKARMQEIQCTSLSRENVEKLKGTTTFPGILAIINMPEDKGIDVSKSVICLDHISDPGNLGTIIRTAEWFGYDQILLSEGSVDPYNEKVIRATMGSLFRVNIIQSTIFADSIASLKEDGYHTIGVDLHGEVLNTVTPPEKLALVLGSESHGFDADTKKHIDSYVTIPGIGDAESLNLGVAAGISLYHFSS